MNILFWGQGDILLNQVYITETLEIVIQEVIFEVSLSRILNAILKLDQLQWFPNYMY